MPTGLFRSVAAFALACSFALTVVAPADASAPCLMKAAVKKSSLAKFYGYVIDTNTGKVLTNVRGNEQTPSASVLKTITAAASLIFLDPNARIKTNVYRAASDPGAVYLVGAGDHTLSQYDSPHYTTYKNPGRLSKLSQNTLTKLTQLALITKVVVDDSYFDETGFNPYWKASDRTNGYITEISPLMLDANKRNADLTSKAYDANRPLDPAMRAGRLFKVALGAQAKGAVVQRGKLPADARPIAYVKSQPMTVWIDHAMKVSDNTETEMLMRHVQKAVDYPTTFSYVQAAAELTFGYLGLAHEGLVMHDASGLAQSDRVTPKLIAELLASSMTNGSPIATLPDYLAATNTYGTVNGRFNGASSIVRGAVRAKSGYIPGLSSLAGLVKARDGHTLAFAFFARNDEKAGLRIDGGTKPAIDFLVAKSYVCGAKLH